MVAPPDHVDGPTGRRGTRARLDCRTFLTPRQALTHESPDKDTQDIPKRTHNKEVVCVDYPPAPAH